MSCPRSHYPAFRSKYSTTARGHGARRQRIEMVTQRLNGTVINNKL